MECQRVATCVTLYTYIENIFVELMILISCEIYIEELHLVSNFFFILCKIKKSIKNDVFLVVSKLLMFSKIKFTILTLKLFRKRENTEKR